MALPLPDDIEDIVQLADWLEIYALQSSDGNSSVGELEKALGIALHNEKIQDLIPQVVIELQRRVTAATNSYPFDFASGSVLQCNSQDFQQYTSYLFCLALSYFGWKQVGGEHLNPRRLFEELCSVAAKAYVDGDVYLIGTSRIGRTGKGFYDSLEELLELLGEGGSAKRRAGLNPQDDHVDLIAWRHFSDNRENKLILFGQCASGQDWRTKETELKPESFWDLWVLDSKVSPFLKGFFIPHRVFEDPKWLYYGNRTDSLLFDRCRISYYAHLEKDVISDDGRFFTWCSAPLGINEVH